MSSGPVRDGWLAAGGIVAGAAGVGAWLGRENAAFDILRMPASNALPKPRAARAIRLCRDCDALASLSAGLLIWFAGLEPKTLKLGRMCCCLE